MNDNPIGCVFLKHEEGFAGTSSASPLAWRQTVQPVGR